MTPRDSEWTVGRHRFVPTGETQETVLTDWWCPTEERWVMCPGPCPDGREHTEKWERTVTAPVVKVYRIEES